MLSIIIIKSLKLDNSYQNMVFKVGDKMDFDKKIKDNFVIDKKQIK